MTKTTFHIQTLGCQMNVLDSELIRSSLSDAGYAWNDDASAADIILFNTCSVRGHAEDKVYSALGRLRDWKEKSGTVLGVVGCMAQKDAEQIFRRAKHVDLVVGPGRIAALPDLVGKVLAGETPHLLISEERLGGDPESVLASFEHYDTERHAAARPSQHQAMVRVMSGCDNFCSYCVVPRVRGPQKYRPSADILAEVEQLAKQGCVEVTLIGQTVNSYLHEGITLAGLLQSIEKIDGIERIKFVTNYPTDTTTELIDTVASSKKCLPYFHIPAQSGANSMLQRMKRHYTIEQYREIVEEIREKIPTAAITSDFIVGFCGETDEEFAATVELVRWARFKNSFVFKYSERPATLAAGKLADDVPYPVKQERNNTLLALQNEICIAENQRFVGEAVEVFVEGISKNAKKKIEQMPSETFDADAPYQLTARTRCDRIVVFDGSLSAIGKILTVNIARADAQTLFGNL